MLSINLMTVLATNRGGPGLVEQIPASPGAKRRITQNGVEIHLIRSARIAEVPADLWIRIRKLHDVLACRARQGPAGMAGVPFEISEVFGVVPVSQAQFGQRFCGKTPNRLVGWIPEVVDFRKRVPGAGIFNMLMNS